MEHMESTVRNIASAKMVEDVTTCPAHARVRPDGGEHCKFLNHSDDPQSRMAVITIFTHKTIQISSENGGRYTVGLWIWPRGSLSLVS